MVLKPAFCRFQHYIARMPKSITIRDIEDEVRDELMPVNRRYPLAELMKACQQHPMTPSQRITFEYILIDGVNNSQADAKRLVKLLHGIKAKVNLIPFNPFPDCDYRSSPMARIKVFRDILMAANITTIIRKTRGEDIDAACGQLVGRVKARGKTALQSD